jgi:hypothetical protein
VHTLALVEHAPARVAQLPDPNIAQQAGGFLSAGHDSARDGHLAARLLATERPSLLLTHAHRGFRGRATPPDPAAAAALRTSLATADPLARAATKFTYGWRTPFAFEIPPYAVPGNAMDAFVDTAKQLDSSWLPQANSAASSVALRLDGRPVPLAAGGIFRLPASGCGGRLVATDGAGGTSERSLPSCGRGGHTLRGT